MTMTFDRTSVSALSDQSLPKLDQILAVELQRQSSNASRRGQSDNSCPVKLEMIDPAIGAWIEKSRRDSGGRVDRRCFRTFEKIANCARPGEIVGPCFPSVFPGNDVIRLMRKSAIRFVT
jgi:hypothetical protein